MGDWRSGPRAMPEPSARPRTMERGNMDRSNMDRGNMDRDRDRERDRDCKYNTHHIAKLIIIMFKSLSI